MAGVCPPMMPFFNGIIKQDLPLAQRIIEFEGYTSPLFIDLTAKNDPEKFFSFISSRNVQVNSNTGASKNMNAGGAGSGTMSK